MLICTNIHMCTLGIAVYFFDMPVFSAVYLLLNIVVLLNLMILCVKIPDSIKELKDKISHMPTTSKLGKLIDSNRLNMVTSLNITTENLPTVSAFGYSFTQESVASIFGISVFATGSFFWNELITLTRENNNIDHKILTLDELKEVREILKMFSNYTDGGVEALKKLLLADGNM